jgi:drug/metabolite transporter (DMT)-like permease
MGTFSPVHWIIAIALMAALGAFVYFIGYLLWAGAKVKGKSKLLAAAILLPLAVLAIVGFIGASNTSTQEQKRAIKSPETERWKSGIPLN